MRKIASKQCFIAGMTGVVADIKNVANERSPDLCCNCGNSFSFWCWKLPENPSWYLDFFLISIGAAIVYNLGSNIFLWRDLLHYKSADGGIAAGVTMDYSIFLLNSYEENKRRFPGDKNRAMGHAISNTFKSIVGKFCHHSSRICSSFVL